MGGRTRDLLRGCMLRGRLWWWRLVIVHATVKNTHGELVTDLDRGAFTVYENGRRQPITVFRRDDVPVSLGLLIDNSESASGRREEAKRSAAQYVREVMTPGIDEAAALSVDEDPILVEGPSTEPPAIARAIECADDRAGHARYDRRCPCEVAMASRGEPATCRFHAIETQNRD